MKDLIFYGIKWSISYIRDPLHKNAFLLIGSHLFISFFGFIFWTLAAGKYATADIGIASAIISVSNLIGTFSILGFTIGIVRFLFDEKDKSSMINSSLIIVNSFSVVLSLIFICGITIWSPSLIIIRENTLLIIIFIILTASYASFWIYFHAFVALRISHFSLIQSLITGIRILGLFLLIGYGVGGIISSYCVGFLISVLIAALLIRRVIPLYHYSIIIHKNIIGQIINFSLGNYISDTLRMLPGLIMPIIIINVMNAEMNAYFFIALMISTILFLFVYSTGSSLLAENTNDQRLLRKQVINSLLFNLIITIPAILIIAIFGRYILGFFGSDYSREAFSILVLLSIVSIPYGINEIFITIYRIEKKVKPVILIRVFTALPTILLGYIFIRIIGLNGVGYAWLICETFMSLLLIPLIVKKMMAKPS